MPSDLTRLFALLDVLYSDHAAGGPLHVVWDDGNLERVSTNVPMYLHYDAGEANIACLTFVVDQICLILEAMTVPEREAARVQFFDPARPRYNVLMDPPLTGAL